MQQKDRERTVARLKGGQLDILVATDVAARGLDVERIGHVVNYDVPYDTESYVHRIGRTGRAGRNGEAILFITPRERNMLRYIERATRQPLEPMDLPTIADVNEQRVARFTQKITEALAADQSDIFRSLIEEIRARAQRPGGRDRRGAREPAAGRQPVVAEGQAGRDQAHARHCGFRHDRDR